MLTVAALYHFTRFADPAALLPARRAEEAARVEGPLTLVCSAPLGVRLHYLVVADRRGVTYGVPVVDDDGPLRRAAPGDGAARAENGLHTAVRHRTGGA